MSENIAKRFWGCGYFFDSHCILTMTCECGLAWLEEYRGALHLFVSYRSVALSASHIYIQIVFSRCGMRRHGHVSLSSRHTDCEFKSVSCRCWQFKVLHNIVCVTELLASNCMGLPTVKLPTVCDMVILATAYL